jgi:hypothetical protein
MASSTAQATYTRQIIFMADEEMGDRILDEARRYGLSKSEVVRTYVEAGMRAADELDEKVVAS